MPSSSRGTNYLQCTYGIPNISRCRFCLHGSMWASTPTGSTMVPTRAADCRPYELLIIQIRHVSGVGFDEFFSRFDLFAHKEVENLVGLDGILQLYAL